MNLFNKLIKSMVAEKASSPPVGQPVQDKHGETFWLNTVRYDDGGHCIFIGRLGHNVGWAKVARSAPSSCLIGELLVFEQYRGRGLGTILLNEVIRLAVVDRIELIWGWVTLSDFLTTKHLLTWYLKCGFQVELDKSETEIARLLALPSEEQRQLIATTGTSRVASIRMLMISTKNLPVI